MSLLNFYGRECPHCKTMDPIIDQLEKETGLSVERLETWHDEKNLKILSDYDRGQCGGVPFFYNTETKKSICGEASLDELTSWATGHATNTQ